MKPPVTGALARQERRPGSSPLFRQGAFVMSDAMSENVDELIAILATFSRTGHNQVVFDFSGNADWMDLEVLSTTSRTAQSQTGS